MMKKLFILTLALGIVSLASAGYYSFEVNHVSYPFGSTVTISGQTTVGLYQFDEPCAGPDIGWIAVEPGSEVAGSGMIGNALCGGWFITDYGVEDGLYYWEMGSTTPGLGVQSTGTVFTVDIDQPTLLTIYDPQLEVFATINLVPEPTTMALLGLGGLFLRCRKK